MERKTIAGCLFLDSGKILLVKRAKEDLWELPGGMLEEGEDPEKTAIRETKEEIGVTPEIVQQFGTYEFNKDNIRYENVVFEATIQNGTPQPSDPEEISDVKWVPVEKLDDYNLSPNIPLIKEDL